MNRTQVVEMVSEVRKGANPDERKLLTAYSEVSEMVETAKQARAKALANLPIDLRNAAKAIDSEIERRIVSELSAGGGSATPAPALKKKQFEIPDIPYYNGVDVNSPEFIEEARRRNGVW